MEKRQFPRTLFHEKIPVELHLGDETIPCILSNLSIGGALLEIESGYTKQISKRQQTQEASFSLSTKAGGLGVEYNARVLRITEEKGKRYFALSFFSI